MKTKLFLILFFSVILTACAKTNPLSDTSWELVSYGDIDAPTPALPDTEAIISFDAEGMLSGNVGCNQFSGSYEVSGDTLEAGPLMATLMYCEQSMDQETAVMMLLNGSHTFEIGGETLKIFTEDGKSSTTWKKVK
jgi:putative lipoprotein